MTEKKTLLARCKKCKEHGHWVFADGTKSSEFSSTSEGALEFMEAVADERASHEQISGALTALENSGFPRNTPVGVIPVITGAISSLFSDGEEKDSPFKGCDPTLN